MRGAIAGFIVLYITGAGPSCINRSFVDLIGPLYVKRWAFLKLRNANKQPNISKGTIVSFLLIGNLSIPLRFGFFEDFAFGLSLGTSFIDWYVQGNVRAEYWLEPCHFRPFDIFTLWSKPSNAVLLAYCENSVVPVIKISRDVDLAKPVSLPSCSHTLVMDRPLARAFKVSSWETFSLDEWPCK